MLITSFGSSFHYGNDTRMHIASLQRERKSYFSTFVLFVMEKMMPRHIIPKA